MKKVLFEKLSAARWHTDSLYDRMKEIIDELRNHDKFDWEKLDEAYAEHQIVQSLHFEIYEALKAMP